MDKEIIKDFFLKEAKKRNQSQLTEERVAALEEAIADLAIMLVGGISND